MSIRHKAASFLVMLFFISLGFVGFAQPTDPGGDPFDPTDPVPITGVEWLLIAGGAYGVKRLYDKRSKAE